MASGRLFLPGWMPARDSNGDPIPNVSVSFYQNGTDILASVFSDPGLVTPLTNPVAANSSGRFPQIYASDAITYSASVEAPYGPAGQPFTFDGLQASQAADIAAANLAQGAAEDAETALADTLAAIEAATEAGGGSAAVAGALAGATAGAVAGSAAAVAVVAGKLDRNGSNSQSGILLNINASPGNKVAQGQNFGMVANGIANDTTALANAIAAATDIQGLSAVNLPVGVIRVTGTSFLTRSNFSLVGQGSGSTIIRVDADNLSGLFLRSATAGAALSNVTIKGLTIDVAGGKNTTLEGIGLYAEKIIGLTLEDVKITGFHTDAVFAGCFDTSATGCNFIGSNTTPDNRVGAYITRSTAPYGDTYGGNLKFSNCEFRTSTGASGTPGYADCLKIDAVDGVFFENCYFGYGAASAGTIAKDGLLIAGVKFSNSWFDAAAGTNVKFLNSGTPNGPVTFTGCTWVGGPLVERNLVTVGDWTDIVITGGSMQWASSDNMYFGAAQRVTITGMSVALADADNTGGGEGINFQGCTDVVVQGNTINGLGFTDNGVLINGGSGAVVTGNRITGCINGISTAGALNNYITRNNGISGNTGTGVADGATGLNKSVGDNI